FRMHQQSLSTLAEERREDGDGEGVANATFPSSSERQKTASRLSLASWFGFSGVNGNGREDRAWRPLGSKSAARRDEGSDGANNVRATRASSHSHRHLASEAERASTTSSSFSSSRTSVSTAPPGLTGGGGVGEERPPHRVHSFTSASTRSSSTSSGTVQPGRPASRSQPTIERRGESAAAAAAGAARGAGEGRGKKNRGVLRFSGLTSILGGGRLRQQRDQRRAEATGVAAAAEVTMTRRNGSAESSISSCEEMGRLLSHEEEEEDEERGEEQQKMRGEGSSDVEGGGTERECPLCFNRVSTWMFPRMTGCPEHASCIHCLMRYVTLEVMENRVEVSCPECPALLHPSDVRAILRASVGGEDAIAKYEEFSVRKCLLSEPDTRWCPAPDCGFAVIAAGCAACPQLRCSRPSCGTLFCYHCKDVWHDSMTCEEARRTRGIFAVSIAPSGESRRGILRYGRRSSIALRRGSSRMSSEAMTLKPGDVKSCPRCRALIVKMDDGSCNHMVCAMCSTEFCWLCLKEISDLHYLSPTGCTFWGKKPWTRKKKLAWQLGTLIGAPLGIALIAGLSVPGIIFGVPVLVGRKVHTRFMHHTKLRRRLITAACVAGSLVVSPVLAVMAVGVGVPIMLAYVYGVVPLSLCRNGGCGWSSQMVGEEQSEDELWTAAGSEADAVAEVGGASGSGLAASSSGVLAEGYSMNLDGAERVSSARNASERRAASAADAASLAPATSVHSGFSVWTARGKSGGDSESCSTGAAKRVRRPSSESGGVTSLNYEEASTKGLAGSQYHYDDKSVHTLGSQAPELLSCCDDVASTKALAGSVHDTKSLSGSAVVHDVCDEPSTSGHHHHHHHNPHRRSVSSTRQCKSHSLSGCGSGVGRAAGGDHREGRESSTLSEDDDEIVHDCTFTAATPTGLSHSNSSHAPFTLVTPAMTPHLSVFAMHAAVAAAAAAGSSSSSSSPAAAATSPPSTSHAAAPAASSSNSSAPASNPDPFGIRTLLDNMKQMVAADEAEIDLEDVYRPEVPRSAPKDSSMSPASRSFDPEAGRPAPPSRQVSATSRDASRVSGGASAEATPTPARRVRWLPSFLTKKSKQ
ncbi:hypothetical protein PMAYCL1PPCAC_01020, partial [Pristionchus mayeri]